MPLRKRFTRYRYKKTRAKAKGLIKTIKKIAREEVSKATELKYLIMPDARNHLRPLSHPSSSSADFNVIRCLADASQISQGVSAVGERIGDNIRLQYVQLKLEIMSPRGIIPFTTPAGTNPVTNAIPARFSAKIDWVEVKYHIVQYKSTPHLDASHFPNTWFERYKTKLATGQDQGLRFLKSGSVRFNNENAYTTQELTKSHNNKQRVVRRVVNVNLKNMLQEYTGHNSGEWRKNIFLIIYAYAHRQGVQTGSGLVSYWNNNTGDTTGTGSENYHPKVNYDWAVYYRDA